MKAIRAGFVLVYAWGLVSCAGADPLPGDYAPALDRPLSHAVCVHVECTGGEVETWGTVEEWLEDLLAVLRDEFRGSELIFDSGAEDPAPEDADVCLDIRVALGKARNPKVEASAAVLDVLAFITIPLLPIWIRDVRKDPGLKLQLTASWIHHVPKDAALIQLNPLFGHDSEPIVENKPIDPPELLTSLMDRTPFFSWTTLGAILVPPFVFEGEDRSAHMESSMGTRVRRLAGAKVAQALKSVDIDPDELLRDIQIWRGPGWWPVLTLSVDKDVRKLSIRLGKRTGEPLINDALVLGRRSPESRVYFLPPGAGLVRIEVVSQSPSREVRYYTVLIDEPNEEQGT